MNIEIFNQFDKGYDNVTKFNSIQNCCCCFGKEVNYLLRKLELKFEMQFILKDFIPKFQNIDLNLIKWDRINDLEQHQKDAIIADFSNQILKLDYLLIDQFESLCSDFELVIASYGSLSHFDIMQMATALTKPVTFHYNVNLVFGDRSVEFTNTLPNGQRILRHILKLDIKKFRNIYDVPLVLVIPANLLLIEREMHKSKFYEFQESEASVLHQNSTYNSMLKISTDFREL